MKKRIVALFTIVLSLGISACSTENISTSGANIESSVYDSSNLSETTEISWDEIESNENTEEYDRLGSIEYPSSPYVEVNSNVPTFTDTEITTESYEYYSDLDELGRCGVAHACIGLDIMPTEDRGAIGQVKPSGWQTVKYDCISGKYLYNRCHLIGFQLAGENANERNLITGTRYLNIDGMLPFENMVADYVKETGNHVMYRVTPDFEGDNLVASGVQIEAQSVEDDAISFNIYAYNIQPGVVIDYETGNSRLDSQGMEVSIQEEPREYTDEERGTEDYIININTMKFHNPDCSSIKNTKDANKESFNGPRQWLIENGYEPCGKCKP